MDWKSSGDLFAAPPNESDFVFVNGLRFAAPYSFDFVCHVKKRQEGKNIVELFTTEFPNRPRCYYENAYQQGLLRAEKATPANNGSLKRKKSATTDEKNEEDDDKQHPAAPTETTETKTETTAKTAFEQRVTTPKVQPLTSLKAGERLRHALHRHEPPCLADPIVVIRVTQNMVAVCKPATTPVHPTGQYRRNTVLGLLASQRPDLGRLNPVHRLDKNVSGLLLLARNPETANALREEVQSRLVRKKYLAVVSTAVKKIDGRSSDSRGSIFETFQGNNVVTVCNAIKYDARAHIASCAPCETATQDGFKTAETKFALVAVSADVAKRSSVGKEGPVIQISERLPLNTALVLCEPVTGRTHQIRVHLQVLGFPIANDVKYGGLGTGDSARIEGQLKTCRELTIGDGIGKKTSSDCCPETSHAPVETINNPEWPLCPHCPMVAHGARDFGDGEKNENGKDEPGGSAQTRAEDLERLYLHCSRYDGPAWSFQAPNPVWVPSDVVVDLDRERG